MVPPTFFFKQKTAYEILAFLAFSRVLFRSPPCVARPSGAAATTSLRAVRASGRRAGAVTPGDYPAGAVPSRPGAGARAAGPRRPAAAAGPAPAPSAQIGRAHV